MDSDVPKHIFCGGDSDYSAAIIDFCIEVWQKSRMLNWRISLRQLLLAGLILLILLIVILPDVDLPDAVFHRGTDLLSLRSLARSVPLAFVVATLSSLLVSSERPRHAYFPWAYELSLTANSRPILLCTIRR